MNDALSSIPRLCKRLEVEKLGVDVMPAENSAEASTVELNFEDLKVAGFPGEPGNFIVRYVYKHIYYICTDNRVDYMKI